MLSVLFPAQAKLPKWSHTCLTGLYNKIFKVKSFIRSSEVIQLAVSPCRIICVFQLRAAWFALGVANNQSLQVTPFRHLGRCLATVARQSLCLPQWAEDSLSTAVLVRGSALHTGISLAEYCRLTDVQELLCIS